MDISNIKQNSKKNLQKNDLDDVIEFLKKNNQVVGQMLLSTRKII